MRRRVAPEHLRCIAHVPERKEPGRVVTAHQCTYEAHAYVRANVKVCRVHGQMRVRRVRPPGAPQLGLDFGEGT